MDKKDISHIFSTEAEDLRSPFVIGSLGELVQKSLCSIGDDKVTTVLDEVPGEQFMCNDDVDNCK